MTSRAIHSSCRGARVRRCSRAPNGKSLPASRCGAAPCTHSSPPATSLPPIATSACIWSAAPSRHWKGSWVLTPVESPGQSGCRIDLLLRFAFANRLTGMVFEPLFEETAGSLVDAFVGRARALGAGASSDAKHCLVAFALSQRQYLWSVEVPAAATVAEVLQRRACWPVRAARTLTCPGTRSHWVFSGNPAAVGCAARWRSRGNLPGAAQ